ncbi:MAG: Rrf2 family transcriptional regulator [Hyphomicrobiaceae bacterium]|nr:Rrf2 family transcriptional regulator [Hyphomicrobiaceae bacterium]
MRLTKQTSHAVRILIHCAHRPGELVKVADIAEQLDLTQQNAFKIVHILARAGFLEAVRGRHGGVRLAGAPADIRIGDVVRATEVTDIAIAEENPSDRRSSEGARPISRIFDDALEAFIGVLDQHTLEDMARSQRISGPPDKPPRKRSADGKVRKAAGGLPPGAAARR